jgi:hypothetical protein
VISSGRCIKFLIKLVLFGIEGRHPILLDLFRTRSWREMRRARLQVTDRRLRYRCVRLTERRCPGVGAGEHGCGDNHRGKS